MILISVNYINILILKYHYLLPATGRLQLICNQYSLHMRYIYTYRSAGHQHRHQDVRVKASGCRSKVCNNKFIKFLNNSLFIQGDSFGTRPKKMRISQRLVIRFWTCIYDYIPCFMKSMSILVCRFLTYWHHRDNDWRLAPCRAQPCHCVAR